ncbi:MAG: hypothetical protein ABI268_04100 [Rhodanobacter sp.]
MGFAAGARLDRLPRAIETCGDAQPPLKLPPGEDQMLIASGHLTTLALAQHPWESTPWRNLFMCGADIPYRLHRS